MYSSAQHGISPAKVGTAVLSVVSRLQRAGFSAYLVGGSVRDLMLGRQPKDFDVATSATPEQIRPLFKQCRLIGRRFRLAHIYVDHQLIEVATFRASGDDSAHQRVNDQGRLLRDNIFGSIEEDALRRDFTVNALFYDPATEEVIDYVHGVEDLRAGLLRLIGDPEQRYREDPVRLLRAARFAAKLDFKIEPVCELPLARMGVLLDDISSSRLFEEVRKLFLSSAAEATFARLRHYGLFGFLFPDTERVLSQAQNGAPLELIQQAMRNTDQRLLEDKPVTPAFLFAVLLWEPVRQRAVQLLDEMEGNETHALDRAGAELIAQQCHRTSIPRRFSFSTREIWSLQPRFQHITPKRAARFVQHPRFRAAYDFLLLRVGVGEQDVEMADWWTQFQETQPGRHASGHVLPEAFVSGPTRRRRPPRRRA